MTKMPQCPCSQWLCRHMSTWSTTTLTWCQHSQRLHRHGVRVVNDYFSTCPSSQWLRRHGVSVVSNYGTHNFWKYQISFLVTLPLFFSKKNNLPCHWLCWQDVRVVNDYAGPTFFANIFVKTKNFAKPFLHVFIGSRWSFFLSKKVSKISWCCPFKILAFTSGGGGGWWASFIQN